MALVVRKQQRKGCGKCGPGGKGGGSRQPKGKGKGKEPSCLNCAETGHTLAQCPKPVVPVSERPCFLCKKPGHMSSKCPIRKTDAKALEGDGEAGDGANDEDSFMLGVDNAHDEDSFVLGADDGEGVERKDPEWRPKERRPRSEPSAPTSILLRKPIETKNSFEVLESEPESDDEESISELDIPNPS